MSHPGRGSTDSNLLDMLTGMAVDDDTDQA